MTRFLWGDDVDVRRSVTQQQAYIAGCDQAVDDARVAYLTDVGEEGYQAVLDAVAHAKKARLNAYGVACPACEGTALPYCPLCDGDGRVMPEHAARWKGRATERDYTDDEIKGIDR